MSFINERHFTEVLFVVVLLVDFEMQREGLSKNRLSGLSCREQRKCRNHVTESLIRCTPNVHSEDARRSCARPSVVLLGTTPQLL